MRPLFLKVLDYLLLAILIGAVTLASCNKLSYAQSVHPHGELALIGYQSNGTQSAPIAAFLCEFSMHSHVMAKLGGEAFALAGIRLNQSDQLSSALPPSFDRERQSFVKIKRSA